jgi:predicted transcriptional regulator
LIFDAVHVFAKALQLVEKAQTIQTEQLSCTKEKSWQDGETFFNYMRLVSNVAKRQ